MPQELHPIPKGLFLLVTTPTESFMVAYEKKTIAWLDKYHPDWSYESLPYFAGPQGVHVAHGGKTLCGLSEQRRFKWGQTLEMAFDEVDEEPTCPTCIGRAKLLPPRSRNRMAVVLKDWSWDNVPEDYRYNGPKYYGRR